MRFSSKSRAACFCCFFSDLLIWLNLYDDQIACQCWCRQSANTWHTKLKSGASNLHGAVASNLQDNISPDTGNIDFLAVHPQYRHLGITKLFLDKLADELLYGKEITLTTYRAGDKADTGWREEYRRLGFAERELLVEYGYPTQRFVLPPKNKEETDNDRNTEKPVSREL